MITVNTLHSISFFTFATAFRKLLPSIIHPIANRQRQRSNVKGQTSKTTEPENIYYFDSEMAMDDYDDYRDSSFHEMELALLGEDSLFTGGGGKHTAGLAKKINMSNRVEN